MVEPVVDTQIKSFKFPHLLHLWCSRIIQITNRAIVPKFLTRKNKAVLWMESYPSNKSRLKFIGKSTAKIQQILLNHWVFSTMQQTHVLFLGRLILWCSSLTQTAIPNPALAMLRVCKCGVGGVGFCAQIKQDAFVLFIWSADKIICLGSWSFLGCGLGVLEKFRGSRVRSWRWRFGKLLQRSRPDHYTLIIHSFSGMLKYVDS